MRPVPVVGVREVSKDALKMPGIQNEQPVEALAANGPHKPLRHAVRLRGPTRRPNDLNVLASEHFVETLGELLIPVANEEPNGFWTLRQYPTSVGGPAA